MIFILQLLCLFRIVVTKQITVTIKVAEETSPYQKFASLPNHLTHYYGDKSHLLYLTPRNAIIKIDPSTGDMSFKRLIDLETICSTKQLCCGQEYCQISFYIPLKNTQTNALTDAIDLKLEIIDRNDNKPRFRKSKLYLSIPENKELGYTKSIDSAKDRDFTSINKISRHSLLDTTNTFKLISSNSINRNNRLHLKLVSPIDYETKSNYLLTLVACDPDSCVNQTIVVRVIDVNDFSPVFEQNSYELKVKETMLIGTLIVPVKANDLDGSRKYNTVYYSFDNENNNLNSLNTFNLDRLSGKLTLRKKLNAKVQNEYRLSIIATDNTNSDSAEVLIKVIDENNCAPVISIFYPTSGRIRIEENSSPSEIAILQVEDNDLGVNSKVTCMLKPNRYRNMYGGMLFSMKSKESTLYPVNSLQEFDYEEHTNYTILVHCYDHGIPALTTERLITIEIVDINEYPPYFDASNSYQTSVRENSPQNSQIVQVKATDPDKNATLRYRFKPSNLKTDGINYTKIDPVYGWIMTNENNIDRETIQELHLVVIVTDTLDSHSKSSSTTVTISVEDENDNRPVFPKVFEFDINENVPRMTNVGRVIAIDKDDGGSIPLRYSLVTTWAIQTPKKELKRETDYYFSPEGNENEYFSYDNKYTTKSRTTQQTEVKVQDRFIVKSNGMIDTVGRIDREKESIYKLLIGVTDQSRLANDLVLTNVTIRILDENDNSPKWLVPSKTPFISYNITNNHRIGDEIMKLIAYDDDIDQNSIIHYYLERAPAPHSNPDATLHFYINGSTGSMLLIQSLSTYTYYHIRVCASDQGHHKQFKNCTLLELFILPPGGTDGSGALWFYSPQLKITLIGALIGITGLISFFLIIAIVCVRRKGNRNQSSTATNTNTAQSEMTLRSGGVMAYPAPPSMKDEFDMFEENNNINFGGNNPGTLLYQKLNQQTFYNSQLGIGPPDFLSLIGSPEYKSPTASNNIPVLSAQSQLASGGSTYNLQQGPATLDRPNSTSNQLMPHYFYQPYLHHTQPPSYRTNHISDADSGDSGNGPSEEGQQHNNCSTALLSDPNGKVVLRSLQSMNSPNISNDATNINMIPTSSSSFMYQPQHHLINQSTTNHHQCFSLPENMVIPVMSTNSSTTNNQLDYTTQQLDNNIYTHLIPLSDNTNDNNDTNTTSNNKLETTNTKNIIYSQLSQI